MKKKSFLERLTGSVTIDTTDDMFDEQDNVDDGTTSVDTTPWEDEKSIEDGELPVDMYQTHDTIVIRTLVAGVNPDDLNISITRDMVTIQGQREEIQEVPDEDYFHRELFWGSFSRSIVLPEEIIIDEAEAKEKHGLLEIILPKLDKGRSAKLSVKSLHGK